MKIHFHYKALDSQEQLVARLLGQQYQTLTMASLGGGTNLVPTICTYCAYFSSPETDPFPSGYEAVLYPYSIYPMDAAAKQTLVSVYQHIYSKPERITHRLSPVARNTRARQGSGTRPYIFTSLHHLLHKSDETTAMHVGRWNVRKPQTRVLRHRDLGGVGPHVTLPRPGRLYDERRSHRHISLRQL